MHVNNKDLVSVLSMMCSVGDERDWYSLSTTKQLGAGKIDRFQSKKTSIQQPLNS